MKELIENVKINYSFYSGEDYYSDGTIEDDLLEIVKNYNSDLFADLIVERNSWPIFYHLSELRENIINWYPFEPTGNILEVGSGCGAITGALCKVGNSVTCIELSKKRSLINAWRHRQFKNLEIIVGNFEDIKLDQLYDYVTLIGVLEYGALYIQSANPYVDLLKKIKSYLSNSGKLIIAIENKLGLKYWAGCKEDHVGRYFEGIEDYPSKNGIETFSKYELEQMIYQAGFSSVDFYYPYPDYKFPTKIYSDEYLPQVGELRENFRNFDLERMKIFDENKAYNTVIKAKEFPTFSNSFLLIVNN